MGGEHGAKRRTTTTRQAALHVRDPYTRRAVAYLWYEEEYLHPRHDRMGISAVRMLFDRCVSSSTHAEHDAATACLHTTTSSAARIWDLPSRKPCHDPRYEKEHQRPRCRYTPMSHRGLPKLGLRSGLAHLEEDVVAEHLHTTTSNTAWRVP